MSFQKANYGEKLGEVYYYIVPSELPSDWKAAITIKGDYEFATLSALKNCPQIVLLMLYPKDKILPCDYSLIRIIKSKKDFIHNEKTNSAQDVINLEEFEIIDPSYVYADVPFERKSITKFIKENLVDDDLVANSFQPTISGSPYIINRKGGISLSTFLGDSSFSEELVKTLKLMQPPDFTDIQLQIPARLIKGKVIRDVVFNGVKSCFSEKCVLGKNYYSGFLSGGYSRLNNELIKRNLFKGEYSIACVLVPRGKGSELLRDMAFKFVKTDITNPFNTDELLSYDINLKKTQKRIDEDLWLQIAKQKEINPIIKKELSEKSEMEKVLLSKWIDILENFGAKKGVEHEARILSRMSLGNVLRVAKSLARDGQIDQISKKILDSSYKLFITNVESLIDNPKVQYEVRFEVPKERESTKFNVVRAELCKGPIDIKDLFSNVKRQFDDIYELQKYIDRLIIEVYLFEPRRGLYQWL